MPKDDCNNAQDTQEVEQIRTSGRWISQRVIVSEARRSRQERTKEADSGSPLRRAPKEQTGRREIAREGGRVKGVTAISEQVVRSASVGI